MPGSWWVPYATAALAMALTVLTWRAIVSSQYANLRRSVQSAAWSVQYEISNEVHLLAAGLKVLAALPPDPEVWRDEARVLSKSFPGLVTLEWIDARYRVRDALPSGDLEAPPLDRTQMKRLRRVRRSGDAVTVTPIFRLQNGKDAIRVAVPRYSRAASGDLVSAVVTVGDFTFTTLAGDVPEFHVELRSEGRVLYTRGDADLLRSSPWREEKALRLPGGAAWLLTVAPSSAFVASIRTSLAELVLGAGTLLALLLGVTLGMTRTRAAQARRLSSEVEQRRRAEEAVRAVAGELETRVKERTAELEKVNAALSIENALRENVQSSLVRSNKDLERFAAFVSHELRQPLATMAIWTDLLESSPRAVLEEKGRTYVGKIRDSIRRMARLIEGELALSRVANDQASRERVDLARLLPELVADLGPMLRQRGSRVEIGEVPVIRADAGQIRQVFQNLIENAIKYRRPDVPPVIQIDGEARACADGSDSECEVRVRDNGRGFEPEKAEELFAMFRRAHESAADGAGVGLAVCRRIIEHHGGVITASGRPGDGATFTIVLPSERCESDAPAPRRQTA